MAYDYLGLVNDVNRRLNEVELTSSNFASAVGEYSMIKDDANMVSILIFDNAFYMATFKENNKLKYSLVLGNSDYYHEDLEKLTTILYDYVKEHIGFPLSNNDKIQAETEDSILNNILLK